MPRPNPARDGDADFSMKVAISKSEGDSMVKSKISVKPAPLYDTDYQLWLETTVAQLQTHDFSNLDLGNLIEENESLGKSDKRSISSYLMRLCEHLLKMKYWESERETSLRGWKLEIRNFRLQIQAILEDSPSLNSYLRENFVGDYLKGRKLFLDGSELEGTSIAKFFDVIPRLKHEGFPAFAW